MTPIPRWLPLAVLAVCVGSLVAVSARAQSITAQDWDAPVSLELRDGRRLEGRCRGVITVQSGDVMQAAPVSMLVHPPPKEQSGSGLFGGILLGAVVGMLIFGFALSAAAAAAFTQPMI